MYTRPQHGTLLVRLACPLVRKATPLTCNKYASPRGGPVVELLLWKQPQRSRLGLEPTTFWQAARRTVWDLVN